ncbi:hypothetical protein Tco_1242750 [Tanacetum coccineum]
MKWWRCGRRQTAMADGGRRQTTMADWQMVDGINLMLEVRARQEGLEVWMTDENMFNSGRARKLDSSSSSSIRSYSAPPPSTS